MSVLKTTLFETKINSSMIEKILCQECNELILPQTAEKTGGICMACKQGIRESIERSKEYYRKQKEYDPYRELWLHLVDKVYTRETGFQYLTNEEKVYFSVGVFDGEVYNGGMIQFFDNSGELFSEVIKGLKILKAEKALSLLMQAAKILFDDIAPLKDGKFSIESMKPFPDNNTEPTPQWLIELEKIDQQYYDESENLSEISANYAETTGLIQPFMLHN